ncbi:MAG: prepilin-type N-terminal cleavage/methylation domain-containing protein [Verrucomicrobiota bacterium]
MTRTRPGMSLIEVLVALVIFVGVVGMLAQAVNISISTMDHLEGDTEREQEFRFAMRQVLQVTDREEMEDGGEIETLSSGLITWESEVEETDILDLFRVTINLTWEEVGDAINGDYAREQVVYLMRNDWAEPDERDTLRFDKERDLENFRRGL